MPICRSWSGAGAWGIRADAYGRGYQTRANPIGELRKPHATFRALSSGSHAKFTINCSPQQSSHSKRVSGIKAASEWPAFAVMLLEHAQLLHERISRWILCDPNPLLSESCHSPSSSMVVCYSTQTTRGESLALSCRTGRWVQLAKRIQ